MIVNRMKAWFNEKGNWCFEFEKSEHETDRLICLVSSGLKEWNKTRKKYPQSFISAAFFHAALGTVFVGQNYSQSRPTIDDPISVSAKELVESAIFMYDKMKLTTEGFNEEEINILKKIKNIKEIL